MRPPDEDPAARVGATESIPSSTGDETEGSAHSISNFPVAPTQLEARPSTTQRETVLGLLLAHEAVCATAFLQARIPRFGGRIFELRQAGYLIERRKCRADHRHRSRQYEYALVATPHEPRPEVGHVHRWADLGDVKICAGCREEAAPEKTPEATAMFGYEPGKWSR